ncbi:lipopolysaccharide biosynthesis protein [Bradyrhizobium sp. CB1015]|uniref:lipopolysaccharide biosynthesis protein n=1 Tax=Bradyrhizobium sp. CB1015 TaxID=2976822 RepID=UPI0021AA2D2B|nr:lipopolysaccharide biosynthesis protein [Bradyrhizobium sp. CB1015]UWU91385.1 lipopolysaccharide biosynthesis protein [Bradyrhizobium sp. CB1015]
MEGSDYRKRARSGTGLLFAQRIISFVLNISQIAIISRLVEPSEFGLVAIALFFSTLFSVFRDFGLPSTAIQLKELQDDQRDALFWFNFAATIVLVLVLLLCASPIASLYEQPRLTPVLMVATLNFFLLGATAQHAALLRRELRFGCIFAAEVGGLILGWLSTIVLAYFFRNALSLVLGAALQGAFSGTGYVVFGRWLPSRPTRLSRHLELLTFGANVATFSGLNFLSNNIAAALVGLWSGSAAAGLFSRAQSLYSLPTSFLLGPYLQVQFPLLCRIAHVPSEVQKEYHNILVVSGLVYFTIGLALPFISSDLVVLLLGPSWEEASRILVWLCPALFALGFIAPFGQFMTSQGRVRELRIWSAADLFFRGGGAVLGCLYGPQEAAAGFSAGTLLAATPIIIWITARQKPISIADQLNAAVPGLATAICTASVTFATKALCGEFGLANGPIRLTVVVLVAAATWGLMVLLLPTARRVIYSVATRNKEAIK